MLCPVFVPMAFCACVNETTFVDVFVVATLPKLKIFPEVGIAKFKVTGVAYPVKSTVLLAPLLPALRVPLMLPFPVNAKSFEPALPIKF